MTIVRIEMDGADVTLDVTYRVLYHNKERVGASRDDCSPEEFELELIDFTILKVVPFNCDPPSVQEIEEAVEDWRDYILNRCEYDYLLNS